MRKNVTPGRRPNRCGSGRVGGDKRKCRETTKGNGESNGLQEQSGYEELL